MYLPKIKQPPASAGGGQLKQGDKGASGLGAKSLSRVCGVLAALAVAATAFAIWSQATSLQRYGVLEEQTREVAVATADIAPGATLGESAVQVVSVPASMVPADAFTSSAEASGKTAVNYISARSIVTRGDCASDEASTLAARIGAGKVAVTVAVTQQSGNAGLVHQGDSVTLVGSAGSGDLASSVLVEHARVLAVDSNLDAHSSDYTSVTVEASPSQAVSIAGAESHGEVTVVLEPAA